MLSRNRAVWKKVDSKYKNSNIVISVLRKKYACVQKQTIPKWIENIWIGYEIREITQDQRGRNHWMRI